MRDRTKIITIICCLALGAIMAYYFQVIRGETLVYTHYFYIPCVLGAIWFKKKGLIATVVSISVIGISNLFSGLDFLETRHLYRSSILLVVSTLVVLVSESAERERFRTIELSKLNSTLLDILPVGFMLVNNDMMILRVNKAFSSMAGLSHDEIENKKYFIEFFEYNDRIKMMEYHRLRRKEPEKAPPSYVATFQNIFGNKKKVILNVSIVPETYDSVATIYDITELEQLLEFKERALKLQEVLSKLNYIAMTSTNVENLIKRTCDLIYDSINPKFAFFCTYEKTATRWKVFDSKGDISISSLENLLNLGPIIQELLNLKGTKIINFEGLDSEKDWFQLAHATANQYKSLILIPIEGQGERFGVLGIGNGLPEAISREELAIIEEMGSSIAQRVSALRLREERERMYAEAVRTGHLASLGELSAGIAHEVSNPLNGIVNLAQIILDRAKIAPEDEDLLNRILKEAERVSRIVQGLLSFARGRPDEETVETSVAPIIEDCLALMNTQLRKGGIVLVKNYKDQNAIAFIKVNALKQVILNVLNNAIYALNEKYPEPCADKILEINIMDFQAQLRIQITDHGTGIESKVIPKIFDPFFSTKPPGKGTGLGLPICRGLIKDMGGEIKINSQHGQFTSVIIDLPKPI
jgi:PAS domain S-box-containing protein